MRIRFSIRDLCWLLVVAALTMGLATFSIRATREQEKLLQEVKLAKKEVDKANERADQWEKKYKLKITGTFTDAD